MCNWIFLYDYCLEQCALYEHGCEIFVWLLSRKSNGVPCMNMDAVSMTKWIVLEQSLMTDGTSLPQLWTVQRYLGWTITTIWFYTLDMECCWIFLSVHLIVSPIQILRLESNITKFYRLFDSWPFGCWCWLSANFIVGISEICMRWMLENSEY